MSDIRPGTLEIRYRDNDTGEWIEMIDTGDGRIVDKASLNAPSIFGPVREGDIMYEARLINLHPKHRLKAQPDGSVGVVDA